MLSHMALQEGEYLILVHRQCAIRRVIAQQEVRDLHMLRDIDSQPHQIGIVGAQDLGRRPVVGDAAAVHDHQARGMLDQLIEIVLDDQERDIALSMQIGQGAHDLALAHGVQVGGGVVEDQDLLQHGQVAGDGDALLLPAGDGKGEPSL